MDLLGLLCTLFGVKRPKSCRQGSRLALNGNLKCTHQGNLHVSQAFRKEGGKENSGIGTREGSRRRRRRSEDATRDARADRTSDDFTDLESSSPEGCVRVHLVLRKQVRVGTTIDRHTRTRSTTTEESEPHSTSITGRDCGPSRQHS